MSWLSSNKQTAQQPEEEEENIVEDPKPRPREAIIFSRFFVAEWDDDEWLMYSLNRLVENEENGAEVWTAHTKEEAEMIMRRLDPFEMVRLNQKIAKEYRCGNDIDRAGNSEIG